MDSPPPPPQGAAPALIIPRHVSRSSFIGDSVPASILLSALAMHGFACQLPPPYMSNALAGAFNRAAFIGAYGPTSRRFQAWQMLTEAEVLEHLRRFRSQDGVGDLVAAA